MPDGDRFERTLRGKGWLRAYRLTFSDEGSGALNDTLLKATAAYLRKVFSPDFLRKFPRAIHQALGSEAALRQSGATASDTVLLLETLLQNLSSGENDFAATEILKKAAESVFNDLEQCCDSTTLSDVEDCLSQELVERVIRHCFLARVRDGIGPKNKRSAEQQANWESQLLSDIESRSRNMLKSFFKNSQGAIRAPKRTTPQRRNTLDELNQGLRVSEV